MKPYLRVYTKIKRKILLRDVKAHSVLPSEHELSAQYGVSRGTVRKALAMLEDNGYIQKHQGKGSVVQEIKQLTLPATGLITYEELKVLEGFSATTKVVTLNRETLSAHRAEQVQLPVGTDVWRIVRQRYIDDEVYALDYDYILYEAMPNLTKAIAETSILGYAEEQLAMAIDYAEKEITIEAVTDEDRELMSLHLEDSKVVVIRSLIHLIDGTVYNYNETHQRADKFRYIDVVRRPRN